MRLVLAVLVAVVAGGAPAIAADTMRVAVLVDVSEVELRGADIEAVAIGACERCPRGRLRATTLHAVAIPGGIELHGRRASGFRLVSDRPIRAGAREYGGALELIRSGDGMVLVNELPLEEYLAGVLRAEVGDRWPREALRAQAIVARTYAAYQRALNRAKPYHILASTAHQQFSGRVAPTSPVWGAARDTAGMVLLWEGELFPAFYHTESGGFTEDPRTVFTARNMPGLLPVVCPFSGNSPHFYWNLDLRRADLEDALRRNGMDVGRVLDVAVTERTVSLRAALLTIQGSRGSAQIRGNDFRRMIGYDTVKSTLFAVTLDEAHVRFTGRGYGHGVGLCQWGAKGMAEQGHRARDILEHYYPGATLGALDRR